MALRERFAIPRVEILDGALGTELERRGILSDLPLWSTWALLEAPDAVESIHLTGTVRLAPFPFLGYIPNSSPEGPSRSSAPPPMAS